MKNKILALACDHGGYELKTAMKTLLDQKGIQYMDFGCDSLESVNYPDYAHKLCSAIQNGVCYRGILFCGTGIGMCMAANKHRGIRAAVCSDTFSAHLTRMHNDANVLCLGGRVVGTGLAWDLVEAFIDTEFEGGRHSVRIDMITALEEK